MANGMDIGHFLHHHESAIQTDSFARNLRPHESGQVADEFCACSIPTNRPYQGVFLVDFARFTEWPTDAFADTKSPIVIGILGADPFGRLLDQSARDESVHGRRLLVCRYRKVAEIGTCHILYISRSESGRLSATLTALKGKPVLTVSDISGGAGRGMMIEFTELRQNIRFRINPNTARTARLTLSSKLLRDAEIVDQDQK